MNFNCWSDIKLDSEGMPTEERFGFFENKTICVFGGTGTIGRLIVEYLLTQKTYAIRIFALSEYSIWKMQQKFNNNELRYLKGDIHNLERVRLALRGVDYVFNAAAVKHVPIAEYNPMGAVETNVIGFNNIITACVENKVKKLLHISTDKAVEPTTLMGATKMISERLLQIRWTQHPEIGMVCVRLGNVWGSRGSIIPIIQKCIEKKKPINITDPNMIRFFMKPQSVVEFIIKAFKEGKKGEIWVPKLKETKLIDMIKNEFKTTNISIMGPRKGEKLSEKLISDWELLHCDETNSDYWVIKNDSL